jgi:hypothetical protein
MASWKKVLVSGSAGEFSSITASVGLRVGTNQVITTSPSTTFLSGSFSGSFFGNGAGLTGVTTSFPTTVATDLNATDKFYVSTANGSGSITLNSLLADIAGNNLLADPTGDAITLKVNPELGKTNALTSVNSTIYNIPAGQTPGYVGFVGTASWAVSASNAISSSYATTASYALNSVGGTLAISGSDGSNTSIILSSSALIVSGTANQISVSVNNANRILQIGLPNNVIIPGNLSVTGTTTTVSASSLLVTDKFIVLSSGSTSKNDGGIIIQSSATPANTGSGYGFILDGSPAAPRWGVTSSLSPTANDLTTPDEYMVTAKIVSTIQNAGSSAPTYGGNTASGSGNMVVDGAGDIWIYVF